MIAEPTSEIWRLDEFLSRGGARAGRMKKLLAAIDEPAIVFPGLVNSHDHLEFNLYRPLAPRRFDDVVSWSEAVHHELGETIARIEAVPFELRWRWGALKNLLSGVTRVVDHGPDRGFPKPPWPRLIGGFDFYHSPESGRSPAPLWRFWDRRPVVVHLAEGTSRRVAAGARRFLRRNVFGRRIVAVHGIGLGAPEFDQLAALVWCPASNLNLYRATVDLRILPPGLPLLFGTDSAISAPGSIWDHIREARGLDGVDDPALLRALIGTPRALWAGLGLMSGDDRTFVVARARADHPVEAFFKIEPPDILAIIGGGEPILWDQGLQASGTGGSALRFGDTVKYIPGDLHAAIAALHEQGFDLAVGGHAVGTCSGTAPG